MWSERSSAHIVPSAPERDRRKCVSESVCQLVSVMVSVSISYCISQILRQAVSVSVSLSADSLPIPLLLSSTILTPQHTLLFYSNHSLIQFSALLPSHSLSSTSFSSAYLPHNLGTVLLSSHTVTSCAPLSPTPARTLHTRSYI